jgi:hypothetical protein
LTTAPKKTDILELNNVEIEDQVLTLPKIRVLFSSISNLSIIILGLVDQFHKPVPKPVFY